MGAVEGEGAYTNGQRWRGFTMVGGAGRAWISGDTVLWGTSPINCPPRNPAEAEKRHDAPWNVPELRAALDLERLVASKAAGLGEGARMCWGVLQGEERRA